MMYQKIFIDYFENQSKPISISNKDWINYDQKTLNLSSTVNKFTSGNNSLKVDVGEGQ